MMPNAFPSSINVFAFFSIILITSMENVCGQNSTTIREKAAELKKLIAAKCSIKYTSNCLLLDVCKVIDKFSSTDSYQILPGVYAIRSNDKNNESRETPIDIFEEAAWNNQSDSLDIYVHKKLNSYLDSISLTIKIMDRNSAFNVRKLSDDLIAELWPVSAEGRGKKKGSKDAAIWAAGAIAALGTSALFAITGKAVLTSLAALMLSMMCYFRGHGGGASGYTSGAIVTPYRQQCAEAIVDVNGRGEHTTAIVGYKKRTVPEDTWNYPRYASTSSEQFHGTEPPPMYHGDSYSKMLHVK